ncbi:MAG: hypothetical protein GX427_08300 [Actinomycetales bacterium]|nr:hypothetical protein [Actinomycetales bacterium]
MDRVDDLALLRRFEPVLRLTAGEVFTPTSVERYVASAQLLLAAGTPYAQVLVERGGLDPAGLATLGREYADEPLSLRYVERPMSFSEHRAWLRRGGRQRFRPISRAAAVGLLARFIAALMQLTLLVRGAVPGGWTAAAAEQARAADPDRRCTYYGRVSRDAGYVILQYWFLYPMNDWRSSFGGVNDHEADWEQITVYVTDEPEPRPTWVAFSSHDEHGADLRRRWDDPDLDRVGEHPVVYVGAGSHSGAYLPGEYLVTVAPELPRWIDAIRLTLARLSPWHEPGELTIGIPYIDYRRGDGLSIGPGQDEEWDAVVIDDDTPWVHDYRGLWGLDTRDRFGGERAPAGPRYERDGRVRQSWGQPIAWADLDALPPTAEAARALWEGRAATLGRRLAAVEAELAVVRGHLREATVAATVAGRTTTSSAAVVAARRRTDELRQEQARLTSSLDEAERLAGLDVPVPPPHTHLRHRALPLDAARGSRVLGVWAAVSAALLMAILGGLLLANPTHLVSWSLAVLAGMIALESVLRGSLFTLVTRVVVTAAALVTVGVLVAFTVANIRVTAGILLVVTAAYLLVRTVLDALRNWVGEQEQAG